MVDPTEFNRERHYDYPVSYGIHPLRLNHVKCSAGIAGK